MISTQLKPADWLRGLALAGLALAPLAAPAPAVAAAPVRVVGCNRASLAPSLVASGLVVGLQLAEDGEAEDEVEEDQLPRIAGSIPKPRGVDEDDSRALAPLVTISREQAVWNAADALANPAQRRVRKVLVEGENGFVIWAVKTELIDPASGPDPKLELKVDAGGSGEVLSIECEADDD